MRHTVVLVALAGVLLTACGEDDTPGMGGAQGEEPVAIEDALEVEGPISVTGYLFVVDDGTVVLSNLMAESFPPQPGGATITVVGLDLTNLALEQAPEGSEIATTQWSNEPVTLTGTMVSGVLEEAVHGQRS